MFKFIVTYDDNDHSEAEHVGVEFIRVDLGPDEGEEQGLEEAPGRGQVRTHRVVVAPALSPPAETDNKGHDEDGERPGSGEVEVRETEQSEKAASHEDNQPLARAGRLGREIDSQDAVEDTIHQTNYDLEWTLKNRPGQVCAGVKDDPDKDGEAGDGEDVVNGGRRDDECRNTL